MKILCREKYITLDKKETAFYYRIIELDLNYYRWSYCVEDKYKCDIFYRDDLHSICNIMNVVLCMLFISHLYLLRFIMSIIF